MTELDATARASNVRDSVKRYFVDNLYKTEGVNVKFDKYLSTPRVQGHDIDRWVAIRSGQMQLSDLSVLILSIYCCTRKDSEGFKLAQLRDKVFKYLTDNTMTDGMARIPFYRSRQSGSWTEIGAIVVQEVLEGEDIDLDDGTKCQILTAKLRFSSKV